MVRKVTLQKVNELTEKFQLQEIERTPKPWLLSETIQPVTDIDELLYQNIGARFQQSITSATTFAVATVPQGEKWRLIAVSWDGTTANLINSIGCRFARNLPVPYTCWFFFLTTGLVDYGFTLPQPFIIEEGDSLMCNCSTYISTDDTVFVLFYQRIKV